MLFLKQTTLYISLLVIEIYLNIHESVLSWFLNTFSILYIIYIKHYNAFKGWLCEYYDKSIEFKKLKVTCELLE